MCACVRMSACVRMRACVRMSAREGNTPLRHSLMLKMRTRMKTAHILNQQPDTVEMHNIAHICTGSECCKWIVQMWSWFTIINERNVGPYIYIDCIYLKKIISNLFHSKMRLVGRQRVWKLIWKLCFLTAACIRKYITIKLFIIFYLLHRSSSFDVKSRNRRFSAPWSLPMTSTITTHQDHD